MNQHAGVISADETPTVEQKIAATLRKEADMENYLMDRMLSS